MSKFQVAVLPEAEQEFREAFLWYFERSPLAADAFREEVFDAIDGLTEDADLWPSDEDGFGFYVLTRFPYTVRFELDAEVATVMAISHHRRRPKYWRERR